jgi:chromosome segregation ATPase
MEGGQAVSHIGDTNKKVSETPISDSTPHNVADLGMLCRRFERLAAVRLAYIKQLESNNDAANAEIERLTNKVAQLYEGAEEQNQRIKRLEESLESANTLLQLVMCEQNQLRDVRNKANDRIKRLEEAGDAMVNEGWNEPHLANAWLKAKEDKP